MNRKDLKDCVGHLIARNYLRKTKRNLLKLTSNNSSQPHYISIEIKDLNSGGFDCTPRYDLIVHYLGNEFESFCKESYSAFPKTFFPVTVKRNCWILAFDEDDSGKQKSRYIF